MALVRKGKCTPDKCETVNGLKGVACCYFDFAKSYCAHLQGDLKCELHNGLKKATTYGFKTDIKPDFCVSFPSSPKSLERIKNCGYYWGEA